MQGYPEESDEIKTSRALRVAACNHAGAILKYSNPDATFAALLAAAVAYAAPWTMPVDRKTGLPSGDWAWRVVEADLPL
jgi:hypothetical protein